MTGAKTAGRMTFWSSDSKLIGVDADAGDRGTDQAAEERVG